MCVKVYTATDVEKLGFKFMKRHRSTRLIEAANIVQWRWKYRTQIEEFRKQGRLILYTEETCAKAGHTTSNVLVDKNVPSAYEARC